MPRGPLRLQVRRAPVVAGRWVLLEELGRGSMGTVHRAWDRRERRVVAAKVMHRDERAVAGSGDELLLRFVREQSLRLQHPHVLAPHGWAADDDVVLLVMDVVAGGSLEGLVRRAGRLPASYVACVLGQVLEGLAALHAAGVVHRDVKPANVLLEPTGRGRPHVRVADLGVAAVGPGAGLTRVPGAVGTEGYLAPECATGATPHPAQDLYAAGVLARRCLAGDPGALGPVLDALTRPDPADRPASAGDALALLRAHVDLDAPWDPDLSPDAADVVATISGPGGAGDPIATACLAGAGVLALAAGLVATWPWP